VETTTAAPADDDDCRADPTICAVELGQFGACLLDNETSIVASCECPVGMAPSTTTGLCVVKCANPAGNPCGPNSACSDDDALGFTCEDLTSPSVCPVGCSPTEECVNGSCSALSRSGGGVAERTWSL